MKVILQIFKSKELFFFVLCLQLVIGDCYSQSGVLDGYPKIAYWKYGHSNLITIIINGGPGYDHTYLQPEWDTLSSICTIVYYDQRGCGESWTCSNYSWIEHLKDLKKLKEHISPEKKVVLAGSSWGTNLALLYAMYFPEDTKGLVLSGFTDWKGMNPEKIDLENYSTDSIFMYKRKIPTSQELDSVIKSHKIPPMVYFENLRYNEMEDLTFRMRLHNKSEEMIIQTLKSLSSMPELANFSEIKIPTLIIKGSIFCGIPDWSDILTEKIKSSELFIIKDSCHDPWYSNSKIFFSKCIDFIKQVIQNEL